VPVSSIAADYALAENLIVYNPTRQNKFKLESARSTAFARINNQYGLEED